MTPKLSPFQIVACLISLFIFLILGILAYSLQAMNHKYEAYKEQVIKHSPYESYAEIKDKWALGRGFEIEYRFRGKRYGEVMKVRKEVYEQYKVGDKIPVILSREKPSFVRYNGS